MQFVHTRSANILGGGNAHSRQSHGFVKGPEETAEPGGVKESMSIPGRKTVLEGPWL